MILSSVVLGALMVVVPANTQSTSILALRLDRLSDASGGADVDTADQYQALFELAGAVAGVEIGSGGNPASEPESTTVASPTDRRLFYEGDFVQRDLFERARDTEPFTSTDEELGVELDFLGDTELIQLAGLARERAREEAGRRADEFLPLPNDGPLTYCPVQGDVDFIDSWGFSRSGGRRHKGVDMMAPIGTPIVAPVAGTVALRSNRVGGRSFHLEGNDGNYYYGTHMSDYGESGAVDAGTIIGYVGDDGNARGISHLHFEIHPGGRSAANPYPAVEDAC